MTPQEQAEEASRLLNERGIPSTVTLQKKQIVISARTKQGWIYEKFPLSETIADVMAAWIGRQEVQE